MSVMKWLNPMSYGDTAGSTIATAYALIVGVVLAALVVLFVERRFDENRFDKSSHVGEMSDFAKSIVTSMDAKPDQWECGQYVCHYKPGKLSFWIANSARSLEVYESGVVNEPSMIEKSKSIKPTVDQAGLYDAYQRWRKRQLESRQSARDLLTKQLSQ